jgi:hypothetical protein
MGVPEYARRPESGAAGPKADFTRENVAMRGMFEWDRVIIRTHGTKKPKVTLKLTAPATGQ